MDDMKLDENSLFSYTKSYETMDFASSGISREKPVFSNAVEMLSNEIGPLV